MEALAPWAEPVLMTADELLRLPDDGWCYELVEGRLVRMSPTGGSYGLVVMALLAEVHRFVEQQELGTVLPAETGFLIPSLTEGDTVLAPDLAFVSSGRAPAARVEGFPALAPDLVAEIASPSQGRAEIGAKARRWIAGGVRLVWIVLPQTHAVEVWREGEMTRTAGESDELYGEDILPGFVLPVKKLFP